MENSVIFRECTTAGEARLIGEFLRNNKIDCQISIDEPIPGLVNSATVLIDKADEQSAQALYAEQTLITAPELDQLSSQSEAEDDTP